MFPEGTALSQLCPSDTLVSVTRVLSRKEAELQPKGISPLPFLFLWHFACLLSAAFPGVGFVLEVGSISLGITGDRSGTRGEKL